MRDSSQTSAQALPKLPLKDGTQAHLPVLARRTGVVSWRRGNRGSVPFSSRSRRWPKRRVPCTRLHSGAIRPASPRALRRVSVPIASRAHTLRALSAPPSRRFASQFNLAVVYTNQVCADPGAMAAYCAATPTCALSRPPLRRSPVAISRKASRTTLSPYTRQVCARCQEGGGRARARARV